MVVKQRRVINDFPPALCFHKNGYHSSTSVGCVYARKKQKRGKPVCNLPYIMNLITFCTWGKRKRQQILGEVFSLK